MTTRYTRTTGETITVNTDGKIADRDFLAQLRAMLNSRDPQKQVNTLGIDWTAAPESALWLVEENVRGEWKPVGRARVTVKWFAPSATVTAEARIDTAMDGGYGSMGMLGR